MENFQPQCLKYLLIFAGNVSHDILVKKLQYQRNTIGKDEMLRHKFELVNMIDFEMFEKQ